MEMQTVAPFLSSNQQSDLMGHKAILNETKLKSSLNLLLLLLQSLKILTIFTAHTQKHRWTKINLPKELPPKKWWTCLSEGFIIIWLKMLLRSTGSNTCTVVKMWVKLPLQSKEADHSFLHKYEIYTSLHVAFQIYSFHWSSGHITYIENYLE